MWSNYRSLPNALATPMANSPTGPQPNTSTSSPATSMASTALCATPGGGHQDSWSGMDYYCYNSGYIRPA